MTADGQPMQVTSTRPAGTVITRQVDGRIERFELTEVLRYDGTHAAEPLDRHL
ncbi:hypothetical protein QFZ55_000017 [Streptomyces luteogriseus]|nr:hypothetical protein [Streptomyces luteogriseus]